MSLPHMAWQDQARCGDVDLDVFYPDSGDTRRAKAFCAQCPVWVECLSRGLDEEHGVWGGLNKAERGRLRRLRDRLRVAPGDAANATDIRRLVAAGMPPERLGDLVGLAPDAIENAVVTSGRRRRRTRRASVGVTA